MYLLGVDHNYQKTIDINGNVVVDPNAKDYFCEGYDSDIKEIVVHDMGNNTRAYMDAKSTAPLPLEKQLFIMQPEAASWKCFLESPLIQLWSKI